MIVEETCSVIDEGLSSQVRAWLDPQAPANLDAERAGIAGLLHGSADWLPLVIGAAFVIADATTSLIGRGDLLDVIVHLTGY